MAYNETPALQPIVPSYHLRILSDEQLEQFKSNTFIILEETGFHCPSEKALKIYTEHGAVVDSDTQIVKLSPDVILEALSHAPRYYTLGGRTEAFDLDLSKGVTYVATDGTGTKTIDYLTRKLRSSIKDDVANRPGFPITCLRSVSIGLWSARKTTWVAPHCMS
jgi:trimethylamine:corrinoid methyltransferase-like protein